MSIDFVLCIGFGGPTKDCCKRRCDDASACPFDSRAACFVSGILGDNPARQSRVDEVAAHYERYDGVSPYNQLTEQQVAALESNLAQVGNALPVFVCYRHWAPFAETVLEQIAERGLKNGLLLILAPHQSSVSWDWYIKTVAEAEEAVRAKIGDAAPTIAHVVNPWWTADGYIDALTAGLADTCSDWDEERKDAAEFIFTAHAIPQTIEDTSPYRQQFAETAELAAKSFGLKKHHLAFQSQPGDSSIPWSSPAIEDTIKALHAEGVREIVVQAAGFLVDHIEVMYDLDYEAKELAESLGMKYHRASCVHAQPRFIEALAAGVTDAIASATTV